MDSKLFNVLWGQCTDQMKLELISTEDYDTWSEKESSVELIENVKGVTLTFRDQKCIVGSIFRAIKNFFVCYQKEDASLEDHLERFKANHETMENYGIDITETFYQFDEKCAAMTE